MLKLFKRKNRIKEIDYTFLSLISKKLEASYPYLLQQVSSDFIIGKKKNKLGEIGSYTLILNASLESKFSNKSLSKFFIIEKIKIWNKLKMKFENVELHILEGMLAGFRLESDYGDLDLDKIDIQNIKEKHFNNQDKDDLIKILKIEDEKLLKFIDLENTFKIEIDEGDFYVIKDLEDGNYLAMDKKGAVYGMIHDPYEIEKLYNTKESFFNDLELGKFNIEEYYTKKMNG
ncbi:fibroblast growth factor [Aquimarina sediminis]|uniref:hypothetical protein n=1 Tax=Aquimarina sediminis TaxID=2070536 RepID=UPI000CA00139|nr:hypothetical protein [Aquimarina sediminis]